MAKYKYSQDVYLVGSGIKTRVKSVINNFSNKKVSYILDNGKTVNEDQITANKPKNELPKKEKKKRYVKPTIEEVQFSEEK